MAKLRVDKIAAPIVKDEFTGSVYFDGTGDYLSLSSNTDFAMGTGDFTAECFINATSFSNAEGSYSERVFDSNTGQLGIYVTSDGSGTIGALVSGTDHRGNNSPTLSGWTHVALTRSGSTVRIFLNGVLDSSFTNSGSVASSGDFLIGARGSGTGGFLGYISNFRICKGHAVYTGNFTPPTRELPVHTAPPKGVVFPAADNRTVLLACQDAYNPLTDSTGRHILTGAGSLGGVPGQNLVTNGQFGQSADNWAETVVSGSIAFARDTTVFSSGGIKVTTGGGQSLVTQTLTGLVVGARYTLSADLYTPSSNPGTDVATISIVNAGYNEGSAVSTDTNGIIQRKSFTFTASGTSQIIYLSVVRADYATFAPSGSIGYFDNISVIVNTPISDANPGLFRNTNITSTITENTGSVYFDGTDDRLDIASSTDFRIADSNTFECWINYNSLPTNNLFLGVESSYWIGYNHTTVGGASNKFVFTIYNGSSWQAVSSSTTPVVGTWYHLAAIKDGTSLKMFINGALENTTTMSGTAAVVNDFFNIGKWNQASAGQGVNGYLSNVRVCKGHAVYKSNFVVPTRELEVHQGPDDDRTVFLGLYDGENIFAEKTGRHIIAAYGDRTSSPTPTATDSPIGITTNYPPVTRSVDATAGPTFQGGAGFVSQNWLTLPKGTTTERDSHGGHRGLFMGGTSTNTIDYVVISTTGNAVDFGDLISDLIGNAACSSSTRGISAGGLDSPALDDTIEFVTIATLGNAIDFGNLTDARRNLGASSNSIRGLFFGGSDPGVSNIIDYITIASTGNAIDFGDISSARTNVYGCASPTRGILGGGETPSAVNTIEYVTIASTGDAQDFGDLSQTRSRFASTGSGTRGVFASGRNPSNVNTIDYVTIASTGNANDFGDVTLARQNAAATSDSVRGVFAGGYTSSDTNTIDFTVIPAMGNAQDFGDLTAARREFGACSSGHGGLG